MRIEDFIVRQGIEGTSIAALFDGVSRGLVEEGLPLRRTYLALPTVNPTTRVFNHIWTRDEGLQVEPISHERNLGAFEKSPFAFLLGRGLTGGHWRFDRPGAEHFPVFDDARAAGATDYLARLVAFNNPHAPAIRGMAAAFSADRPGGLDAAEIARIDAVLPLVAVAAYRIVLFDLAVDMLDTYVGLAAGRRVLNGEIRRGIGTTLTAALLIADLRGFTALADTAGTGLIARLDAHLGAMAAPVLERGGEVLKFLGDGVLAAFPIGDGATRESACALAGDAAREALRRNAAVNAARAGEPALALDVAVHCGDVFHGNIGASTRLDFTVIGPAVNEVSRMEALCAGLGTNLLLSAGVAEACGRPVRSLGRHALRGLAETRELFTLA